MFDPSSYDWVAKLGGLCILGAIRRHWVYVSIGEGQSPAGEEQDTEMRSNGNGNHAQGPNEERVAAAARVRGYGRRAQEALRGLLLLVRQAEREMTDAIAVASAMYAEAEVKRIAFEAHKHHVDPHQNRRGSLPLAVGGDVLAAGIDLVPAYWAALALDSPMWETLIVTGLLVTALAGLAAILSTLRHEGNKWGFVGGIVALVVLIVIQTGLRLRYLLVVTGVGFLQGALEAAMLAVITGGLLWIAYFLLVRAEPVELYKERREVGQADKDAKKASKAATSAEAVFFERGESLSHAYENTPTNEETLKTEVREMLKRVADAAKQKTIIPPTVAPEGAS